MARWRTIAGALALGALVLPARDQWRSGSFAWSTWARLRTLGRGSPASDLDRRLAALRPSLAQSRVAGLLVSSSFTLVDSQRLVHQVQYALAPTIILPTEDATLVVVVGPIGPSTREPDPAAFELQPQSDDYLRLYRRRAR